MYTLLLGEIVMLRPKRHSFTSEVVDAVDEVDKKMWERDFKSRDCIFDYPGLPPL